VKRQLITFEGGLNTKLDESLVAPNYGVGCSNIDLSKGTLFPYYATEEAGTVNGKYIYFNNGTLVQNTDATDVRSYVSFGNRIYWTNGTFNSFGLTRYDGTDDGVEATAPVAPDGSVGFVLSGTTGGLNGDYSYCYTYVDNDGIESAPSGFYTLTTTGDQDVDITISGETNTPLDISKRRIYRTGGNNPTFNLIKELDNPTLTYKDITRDIDVSRIELATNTGDSAPSSLKHLIENSGTFWGSVDNRVYFSANGQPEYWNELDFLQLNDDCAGLGKFGEYVLAFTKSDTYLIAGFNRDTVSIRQLPYREGCVNHNTIANVGEFLLWASYNGICIFNGSAVDVMTKNILSWNKNVEIGESKFGDYGDLRFDSNVGYKIDKALGVDGHYYAIFQDGVLDIDVLNRQTASTIYIQDAYSLYYDDDNDVLHIVAGTDTYTDYMFDSDTDSHMTAQWITGKIQGEEGYGVKKQYRKIEFSDVVSNAVVVVDNKRFEISNRKEFFLPSGYIGSTIQIEIETNRPIRSVEYQYGVLR
jgi:hypothetical protein